MTLSRRAWLQGLLASAAAITAGPIAMAIPPGGPAPLLEAVTVRFGFAASLNGVYLYNPQAHSLRRTAFHYTGNGAFETVTGF